MKRNILNEVNRMREIMGLKTILEQTNNTERLFFSLLDNKSKIYWQNAGKEFSCSTRFYFKYRFPVSELKPEKLTKYDEGPNRNNGVEGEYFYTSYDYIPKTLLKDDSQYRENLRRVGENTTGFVLNDKEHKNPEYNESALNACNKNDYKDGERVASAKEKRQSGAEVPPMTEENKEGFIKYFTDWCIKKYPEKRDNNSPDWGECRKNIKYIKLTPGALTTTEGKEEEAIPAVRLQANINKNTQGEPFPNNSTQVGPGVVNWVTNFKSEIETFLKTYPGAKVSVADKVSVDGSVKDYPFTIWTSASRYRNTGQAEQMSFKELSEARAQSVYKYIVNQLSSIVPDIGNVGVTINSNGRNGDGSSGPNPPSPNLFSTGGGEFNSYKKDGNRKFNGMDPHTSPNEYEQYKFCIIQLAVEFNYDTKTEPSIKPPSTLGEWGIKIVSESGGDGGGKNKRVLIKFREGGGNLFKDSGGITCAAYN
jgi:hypothetical protein